MVLTSCDLFEHLNSGCQPGDECWGYAEAYAGTWVAESPEDAFQKVVVSGKPNTYFVEVWDDCSSKTCSWGKTGDLGQGYYDDDISFSYFNRTPAVGHLIRIRGDDRILLETFVGDDENEPGKNAISWDLETPDFQTVLLRVE